MTSRERVQRCLSFEHPDRIPRDTWLLPIAWDEHGKDTVDAFMARWPSDFLRPALDMPQLVALIQGDAFAVGEFRDEWGCVFENAHPGVIGQVKHPQMADWAALDDLRPPLEALEIDVDDINRQCAASDKYVLSTCCPRPFERIQFLRGTENVFMDIARNSKELRQLIDKVHAFYREELLRWAQTDVDGLTIMDDWGTQEQLLISPKKWRELFKPLYAEYAQIAHDAGKTLFMHSDGHIFAIYEDLIEIGIDAVNSQLFCMDLAEIGKRFKGRITFWGEIDRQHVLPHPDPQRSRDAVHQVVEHLYDPSGGVIAQFELGCDVRLENAEVVYQTWEDVSQSHSAAR